MLYTQKDCFTTTVREIIIRRSSPQGYRTKFPLKKKGSPLLRVVYNFILVNTFTIKLGYPTYHLKEVVNTLIKVKFYYFFSTNAVNRYQTITIRVEDRNQTRFLILNR